VRATVSCDGNTATFWSVHSSALYSPYAFTNDTPCNYACPEVFYFTYPPGHGGRRYRCHVEHADWYPGDGFATLTLARGARGRDELTVRFYRGEAPRCADPIPFPCRTP